MHYYHHHYQHTTTYDQSVWHCYLNSTVKQWIQHNLSLIRIGNFNREIVRDVVWVASRDLLGTICGGGQTKSIAHSYRWHNDVRMNVFCFGKAFWSVRLLPIRRLCMMRHRRHLENPFHSHNHAYRRCNDSGNNNWLVLAISCWRKKPKLSIVIELPQQLHEPSCQMI